MNLGPTALAMGLSPTGNGAIGNSDGTTCKAMSRLKSLKHTPMRQRQLLQL